MTLKQLSVFCQHHGESSPPVREKKDGRYVCLGCGKEVYDQKRYEA